MWFIPVAIIGVAVAIGMIIVLLHPQTPGTPTSPINFWGRMKVWYVEDWFKVTLGGVILVLILLILNHHLAWWLSGHHPRLFISLVLLIVLGVLVLQKNYEKTRKWIWRVGLAMVLVFGLWGAISEDTEKDEPSLGHSLLRESQREAVAEVKEEAISVYASYKNEARKGTSSYSPPPPPTPSTPETKDFPAPYGKWELVKIPGGWTDWNWSTPGKVMIYDLSWKLLHNSWVPGDGELGQTSGFWVQSANNADTTITLTRVK